MRVFSRLLTVAAVAVVGGGAVTMAAVAATSKPADDGQPSLVEDYEYPGAAKILAERGIILHKGDGHITLADCGDGTGLIQFRSRDKGLVCFKATGPTGYLSLEIPSVYLAKGDDHAVKATLTAKGQSKTYDVDRNAWTSVGEGTSSDPATLVEIRTAV